MPSTSPNHHKRMRVNTDVHCLQEQFVKSVMVNQRSPTLLAYRDPKRPSGSRHDRRVFGHHRLLKTTSQLEVIN